MDNNQKDFSQMFELLRDQLNVNREETRADIKELRDENRRLAQETNQNIKSVMATLSTHALDDADNQEDNISELKLLSERIACIESAKQTNDQIKDRNWGHFSGWAALIVACVTAFIMFIHK